MRLWQRFSVTCCARKRTRVQICGNPVLNILRAGPDRETDLTGALLSAPRRSVWWMDSNQQQTDLPQETSPHHVYGNQHFSRDTLIASQGEGEGAKTIGFSLIFCKENQQTVNHSLTTIWYIQACCQMAFRTMQQHRAWLTQRQVPKFLFWE